MLQKTIGPISSRLSKMVYILLFGVASMVTKYKSCLISINNPITLFQMQNSYHLIITFLSVRKFVLVKGGKICQIDLSPFLLFSYIDTFKR